MKLNLVHTFLYACILVIGFAIGQLLINVDFSLEMKLFFVIYGTLWAVLASFVRNTLEEMEFESWRKK